MQSVIGRIYIIFIAVILSAVFLSRAEVAQARKIPSFQGRVQNALTNAPVSGVWVKWQTSGCPKCALCMGASASRYEKTDLDGYFTFDPIYPNKNGCTDTRVGKRIDTNLDGVNNVFQIEKISNCTSYGVDVCTYDFGCYGSPADFSVVMPAGWSGYFDSISDYYFNNSQSDRNSNLGVIYYHPVVVPTPTPTGSTTSVVDFGIVPSSGISGTVFVDDGAGGGVPMNGVRDGGEAGYGGAKINISGIIFSQRTTNAAGNYSFLKIPNGNYEVEMVVPANYTFTSPVFVNVTIPPGRVVNFGIVPAFTIEGNVFNDVNKNLHKDGGELNIASAVIKSSGGTVTVTNGHYEIEDLPAGTYTVSYTSSLAAGFYMLYPAPPSFSVRVGPGCNVDTTTGASCLNNSIINLNFAITNSMPWIQTYGLDIRNDNGFENSQPASTTCGGGSYASGLTGAFNSPGVIFSGDMNPDFGQGSPSSANWVAGGMSYSEVFRGAAPLKTSARNLRAAAVKAGSDPIPLNSIPGCANPATDCNLPNNLAKGIYYYNGDIRFRHQFNNSFQTGNAYVFIAENDHDIYFDNNASIVVPAGAIVFFAAGRDIKIDRTIGTATNVCPVPSGQLQGIFSADRNLIIEGNNGACGAGADRMLNIEGSLIANAGRINGSFQNRRDLCGGNLNYPSITIKARPDFILHTPGFLTQQNTISQEETP